MALRNAGCASAKHFEQPSQP